MPFESGYTTRRRFLAASVTAGAFGLATTASADAFDIAAEQATGGGGPARDRQALRPFRIGFPDADLGDLRRRILATRWPDKETVSDDTQGLQLATMQALARYWASDYDWRKCEARQIGRASCRERVCAIV